MDFSNINLEDLSNSHLNNTSVEGEPTTGFSNVTPINTNPPNRTDNPNDLREPFDREAFLGGLEDGLDDYITAQRAKEQGNFKKFLNAYPKTAGFLAFFVACMIAALIPVAGVAIAVTLIGVGVGLKLACKAPEKPETPKSDSALKAEFYQQQIRLKKLENQLIALEQQQRAQNTQHVQNNQV